MIITKLEAQKKNKDRVSIYIDDEYAFGIDISLVYDFKLKKGMEIDQNFIDQVLLKEDEKQAHIYALKVINYRPRCEAEIRKKMAEKGYSRKLIDNTIDYLIENDFLNDTRFAKLYIESKLHQNQYGPNRIRYQLLQLGLDRSIVDNALRDLYENNGDYEDYSEYNTALILAKKKLSSLGNNDSAAKYRKLSGFLGRKGYSYEVISRICSELIE